MGKIKLHVGDGVEKRWKALRIESGLDEAEFFASVVSAYEAMSDAYAETVRAGRDELVRERRELRRMLGRAVEELTRPVKLFSVALSEEEFRGSGEARRLDLVLDEAGVEDFHLEASGARSCAIYVDAPVALDAWKAISREPAFSGWHDLYGPSNGIRLDEASPAQAGRLDF